MSKVTLEVLEGPKRGVDADGWEHNAYTVRLRYEGRRSTVAWKSGLLLEGPPTAKDVLECLFLDAAGFDNARGFEDWAAEYGYSDDSREAERVYRAVKSQTNKLARLFGVSDHDLAPWQNVDASDLARSLS